MQQLIAGDQHHVYPGGEQLPQEPVTRNGRGRGSHRSEHDGVLGQVGQERLHLGNRQSMEFAQVRPHEHRAVSSPQRLGHDKRKRGGQHAVQDTSTGRRIVSSQQTGHNHVGIDDDGRLAHRIRSRLAAHR